MIDPGALGTLVIGLEHLRDEQRLDALDPEARPSRHASRPQRPALVTARVLRAVADRLDPRAGSPAMSPAR